jgi:hypothetical protein
MKYFFTFLALLFLFGCKGRSAKINVKIALSADRRSLFISGMDKAVIAEIGRDSGNDAWQALLPVCKMPADTELKEYQDVQPGKYVIADSVIVFTPDTSFKKGQSYFLRYYQYQQGADVWQLIRDNKRPGSLSYKDLIFKY